MALNILVHVICPCQDLF